MVAEATLLGRMIDFMASAPTPQQIVDMKATPAEEERLSYLSYLSKEGNLSFSDKEELDAILLAEHLMIRAKAIAFGKLKIQ